MPAAIIATRARGLAFSWSATPSAVAISRFCTLVAGTPLILKLTPGSKPLSPCAGAASG
jgi:hypothetical protein